MVERRLPRLDRAGPTFDARGFRRCCETRAVRAQGRSEVAANHSGRHGCSTLDNRRLPRACCRRGNPPDSVVQSDQRRDGLEKREHGDDRNRRRATDLQELAQRHLWLHFARMGGYDEGHEIPIIARGEGCYVWDDHGKRYLDALSALFCVEHRPRPPRRRPGRRRPGARAGLLHQLVLRAPARDRARGAHRLARARRPQPRLLHQRRLARRSRPRSSSPASTTSSRARPNKTKVIARETAYHGATLGALSATGHHADAHAVRALHARRLPRAQHEPLPPGARLRRGEPRRVDRPAHRVRGPRDGRRP